MPVNELRLTLEPSVVAPLAIVAAAYTRGVVRVWGAAGVGRGIARGEVAAFAVGWLTLVVALVSPLDRLGEQLFSAHMVQHELLMIVAAPLFVCGAPLVALAWAAPAASRTRVLDVFRGRAVTSVRRSLEVPAIAWLLHAAALWVWHLPTLFQATLESEAVHAAQHLSFFGSALVFWWGMSHGRYGRLGYGAAVLYVFATAVHSGVLGALLTFAPSVWYPAYAATTGQWGLSPLEDQQLGGLIMWVPAGLVYTGVGLWYFAAWIRQSDRRTRSTRWTPSQSTLTLPATTAGRTTSSRRVRFMFLVSLLSFVVVTSSGCTSGEAYRAAAEMTGGDPARGRDAISRYGCDTCHTIPGIQTARGLVGPPLTQIADRVYIAGRLPNTPVNLESWIRHPHGVEPHTVMPETGVTESDGRDIAAYLYTLR